MPRRPCSLMLALMTIAVLQGLWFAPTVAAQAAEDPSLLRTQQVVITITNLSQVYDGQREPVTITTTPAGISTQVLYSGSTTPPTTPGSYSVVATVTEANYSGSATATETISSGSSATTATGGGSGTSGTTTATGGTGSASSSSGSSSSSSSFLNGLPCGLGSGTGVLLVAALWVRRRQL